MLARKAISKKVRFEVFKRDSFKCQYCGAEPPNVILHVDHIHPVSKDGANDMMNYITACQSCNLGKSATTLSDNSVIKKQKEMLNELNAKREQLEMLLKWREGLKKIDNIALQACIDSWNSFVPGYSINEHGIKIFSSHLKKFTLNEILDAIETSVDRNLSIGESGKLTQESVEECFTKIGRILKFNVMPDYLQKLLYCRGIARKRLAYCNDVQALILLREAFNGMVESYPDDPIEDILSEIKEISLTARSWTEFRCLLQELARG